MSIFDFFRQRKSRLDNLAAERQKTRRSSRRIRVSSRITELLDPRSARRLFDDIVSSDPLGFPDYAERVRDFQKRSGLTDAFTCAVGTINGHRVICAELIGDLLMGSMGTAVGEAICRSAEYALEHRLPLITFTVSGGARMHEGMFSLMQMAKTAAAVRRLSDAGVLYISVLANPTTGGVTASFASLGDIILAEPGSLIGFAGPRVIEQTIGTVLPDGFQSAEFQMEHGFVDAIISRAELRETITHLLSLHAVSAGQGVTQAGQHADQDVWPVLADGQRNGVNHRLATTAHPALYSSTRQLPVGTSMSKTPTQHVEIARNSSRPHARAFIAQLFDGFFELHGDRLFGDDPALIGGLAAFEGVPVTVAAHLKGSDLNENISSNFGMAHPEGYRKFIRLINQAEKFNRPVITFIDTPGAYPGIGAEERGQAEAIARCLYQLSALEVPVITVITGEGGSGGALALGLADHLIMLEYAVYSILSPEGFASILWKDAKRATQASELMKLTAYDLLSFGMIDEIVSEPPDGAHIDAEGTIESLRPVIRLALNQLLALDTQTLLTRRYERFRKYR
jgi:acetyl-CoA carboxylase carboxyl transferase subunit beta